MKVTKERLSYLKQAQYVQRLAEPYIRKREAPAMENSIPNS